MAKVGHYRLTEENDQGIRALAAAHDRKLNTEVNIAVREYVNGQSSDLQRGLQLLNQTKGKQTSESDSKRQRRR